MPIITLASPWAYRTPIVTTEYPAGTHTVSDAVAEAALMQESEAVTEVEWPTPEPQPEQEAENGHRTATPRAPRRARKAES
jgi:hypothetical protein